MEWHRPIPGFTGLTNSVAKCLSLSHKVTFRCITSSSAVADRPRDALCPSVVSLNKITYAESFIIVIIMLQIYHV